VTFGVVIRDQLQNPIFGNNSLVLPSECFKGPIAAGRIICTFPRLPLMPGRYSCDLYFGNNGRNFDVVMNAISFTVEEIDVFGSGRLPPANCGRICWDVHWNLVEFQTELSESPIAAEELHA
jgi:lipopolysaccharide transport system ATP-binding protein